MIEKCYEKFGVLNYLKMARDGIIHIHGAGFGKRNVTKMSLMQNWGFAHDRTIDFGQHDLFYKLGGIGGRVNILTNKEDVDKNPLVFRRVNIFEG